MKKPGFLAFSFFLVFSLQTKAQKSERLIQYVNPLIGTEKFLMNLMGNTMVRFTNIVQDIAMKIKRL